MSENELKGFIEFVQKWFPSIVEISVFGSYLRKDTPRDIDVLVKFDNYNSYEPSVEAFKIFPHIHYCKNLRCFSEHQPIIKIIWKRGCGILDIHPRVDDAELLEHENRNLREQLSEIRRMLHHLDARIPVSYGY